jgi:hypothetical protein
MKYFLPLFFVLISGQLFGQDDHFYGTCGNEVSNRIFFDGHNRYIAGTSDADYFHPTYVVKTDTLGNVVWCKAYTCPGDVMEIISIAPDKLMILLNGPLSNAALLTIDTAGNVIRHSLFQSGFGVKLLANYFNSIIVAGNNHNDLPDQPPFLAVLDTASNWLYGKYYTISDFTDHNLSAFAVNADSTIFCVGISGQSQTTFFKADPSLAPGTYHNIVIHAEEGHSVYSMPGGGYLIAGGLLTDNTLSLIKVNASGTVLWKKKYGSTTPGLMPTPFSCLSSDGSKIIFSTFLLTFYTNNPITRTTYAVVETDTSGALLFSRNYGDTAYEYFNGGISNSAPSIIAEGNHVVLQTYTPSNIAVNAFVSSNYQTDFQVLKLDNGFNSSIASRSLPMTVSTNSSVQVLNSTVTGTPLNMYLWNGPVNTVNQIAVVTNASQCIGVYVPELGKTGFMLYPNPTSGVFSIQMNNDNTEPIDIKVYSSIGKLIFERNDLSPQQIQLDLSNEAQGIYFVEIVSGNEIYRQKLQVNR